jgi:copper chaperone CopZ
MEELVYRVPGISCSHCTHAIETEVALVPGVEDVSADLDSKRVVVRGEALDDAVIRAAIDEAGYEAA